MNAVKFIDEADDQIEIEGLGMPYGGPFNGQDLSGEHFTPRTNFAFDWFVERPLLYHHGLDKGLGISVVGRVKSWSVQDESGVWTKAQLDKSNEYFGAIKDLVKQGKLYFSSGSMRHLVDVDKRSGEIKRWPWVELSLTPTPANLLAEVGFGEAAKHFESAGLKSAWDESTFVKLPDDAFAYVDADVRRFQYRNDDGELFSETAMKSLLDEITQSDLDDVKKAESLEVIVKASRLLGENDRAKKLADLKLSTPEVSSLVPEDVKGRMVSKVAGLAKQALHDEDHEDMDEDELISMSGDMSKMNDDEMLSHMRKVAKKHASKSIELKAVSWEETRREVEERIQETLPPSNPNLNKLSYVCVEQTFSTYVIAQICSDDDSRNGYYRVEFTRGDDGHVISIGELVEVEKIYQSKAFDTSLVEHAETARVYADSLVERTKDLFERRLKEGRVISTSNRKRLMDCVEAMDAAAKVLQDLISSTEPQSAKAASVIQRPDRRLDVLKLYFASIPKS